MQDRDEVDDITNVECYDITAPGLSTIPMITTAASDEENQWRMAKETEKK